MSIVKVIEAEEGFKPITLSITLETQEEVKALRLLAWRDHNAAAKCISDNHSEHSASPDSIRSVLSPILEALKDV